MTSPIRTKPISSPSRTISSFSDFSLTDAIESGLVKIPQLAVRDTTGAEIPGYFNIWRWIMPQLSSAERGGRKGSPKPEAILKYANTPISMLAGLWEELRLAWESQKDDPRPPVFCDMNLGCASPVGAERDSLTVERDVRIGIARGRMRKRDRHAVPSPSAAASGGRTLIATSRFSRGSRALVDDPHATRTDFLEDGVAAQASAGP